MDKVNLKYIGEVLTVSGLIKELQKYDQDRVVFVYGDCSHDGGYAKTVYTCSEDLNTVYISKEI